MEERLINETLETYQNSSVRELKIIIILTKLLKNMHSSVFIFAFSLIIAMIPVTVLYYTRLHQINTGWLIFPIALIVQLILHKTLIMNHLFTDTKRTFHEQQTIQYTLENMIKTKRG